MNFIKNWFIGKSHLPSKVMWYKNDRGKRPQILEKEIVVKEHREKVKLAKPHW